VLAAVVEELAGIAQRPVDQLVGMTEVDRLDAERARWRQHDQARGVRVALDVVDQAALGEQAIA